MSSAAAGNALQRQLTETSIVSRQSRRSPSPPTSTEEPCANVIAHKDGEEVELIDWDGENDPENPFNWPESRKWMTLGATLIGTVLLAINGTSITVAAEQINNAFNVSDASFPNSYWPVTSWAIGGTVFILVGLPLMEDTGVRIGYLSFYSFFILMIIPQALAPNFATLIVTRFFSGGCVTLLANSLSSLIPDLWAADAQRSLPVSLFILCYLLGNTLGPPVFAGVIQHIGAWRWIFYIQLIIYGAFLPVFVILVRETRADVILSCRAAKIRKETGRKVYSRCELEANPFIQTLATAPLRPLRLVFTEPVLAAITLWSAFSVALVYVFTQSVGQVFTGVYGWHSWSTGYVQGAVAIGEVVGWTTSFLSHRLWLQSSKRNTEAPGEPIPEARLYVSIVGSVVGVSGGMFIYGWTSYPSIPWIAPAIGLGMVGFGIQTIVGAVGDYTVDAYAVSGYAGSAVSATGGAENIMAAFMPLTTQSMYRTLGFHWASTLLGILSLLLCGAAVLLVWKGRKFREKSPFMMSGGQLDQQSTDVAALPEVQKA